MSVQAGWIGDSVRRGLVLMESKRPCPSERLAGGFGDIRRHTHPDRVVLAKINKAEISDRPNLRIAPRKDLFFRNRQIADETVSPMTQDRGRDH
jgi:hypothetical protein